MRSERAQRGGQWRERRGKERSHQQCLRRGIWEASCLGPACPGVSSPPVWALGRRVRKMGSRSGGGGGGWLCQSPAFSSFDGQGPPPLLLLFQNIQGGERERHQERTQRTTVTVWLDCFGQSWETGWDCSCPGGRRWVGCPLHHFPDPRSSPASPG